MNAMPPDNHTAPLAFVTGFGRNDTRAPILSDGRPNPHPHAGKLYETITDSEILALVMTPPPAVPKASAQWFIPSTYVKCDARSHEVQRACGEFYWLTLDIDQGNLALSFITEALSAVLGRCRYLAYSTSSATADARKWRALVPLAAPVAGIDYYDTQAAFFTLLEAQTKGALICDVAMKRTGQPVYLPNPLSGFYEQEFARHKRLNLSPEHPVIVRREETRAERFEVESAANARRIQLATKRDAMPRGKGDDPIETFNARHTIADLLDRYGYIQAGASPDWRSPRQTGTSFGTRDYGTYWTSLSGSDASAGLGRESKAGARFGDAFDLYCYFEHDGDMSRAAKSYLAELSAHAVVSAQSESNMGVPLALDRAFSAPHVASLTTPESIPQPDTTAAERPREYIKDRSGRPSWCTENACLTLELQPEWAGVLAYDEFEVWNMILRPIPGTSTPKSRFKPREMIETDITAALRWFNRHGFPRATRNVLTDAMCAVARETIISPVRHYLEGLCWDGVPRISRWLQTYCEAPAHGLVGQFGRSWLIAAVARALQPGCKADNALVLEGPQGVGKSSVLRVLAGNAWFFDGLRDMHGKDASASLRGKWIIELSELSAMRRSDTEAVKAFLSRTDERYRPAYGRSEVLEPRRCVFAGTTNRNDYLSDDTGGRRFWPVPVGKVDLDGLTRDRDQIWAEAVGAFRAGEPWWLSAENEAEAAVIVSGRQSDDPWSGEVLARAAGRHEVSTSQILELMNIPLENRGRRDAMRIAEILTRAGWNRDGKFKGGPYKDSTHYVPPVGPAADQA